MIKFNKKIIISLIVFCLSILALTNGVNANNLYEADSLHREMAIACAMSYVPLQENKKMSECFNINDINAISEIVNFFNAKINLHDYASINEVDDWMVVDYRNKEISEKSMAAFLLKKDNNLIIVFRGTDIDWPTHIVYATQNYHSQEQYANKYVLEILDEYCDDGVEYNVYVTGHSLGGYLAQIAGAKIEQTLVADTKYSNIHLKEIVDFNGIGINFLTKLGDTENYGNQAENIATLKKLGEEGRLIEYYTFGDCVSALGVHYGEMRELLPSIDSITYHRENFKLLGDFNEAIQLSENLYKFMEFEEEYANIFKTEVLSAREFYKLNDSILGFLLVTHEADSFACIDIAKAEKSPEIKVTEIKGLIASYFAQSKEVFETSKSITLKASTNYASSKRYEWYSSTDNGATWNLEKVSTIFEDDAEFDLSKAPTNKLDIDISSIEKGASKLFKVVAYYDDVYVKSKYNYNEEIEQYEYIKEDIERKFDGTQKVEKIIEVKRKDGGISGSGEVGDVIPTMPTGGLLDKIISIVKDIINKIMSLFTGIFNK
ncbi:MAG: DUF2974 domain-containing protein [Clostridiales bacterium]|nr:DUF2974 domain-containing protein [Clostridiales bacterium]